MELRTFGMFGKLIFFVCYKTVRRESEPAIPRAGWRREILTVTMPVTMHLFFTLSILKGGAFHAVLRSA